MANTDLNMVRLVARLNELTEGVETLFEIEEQRHEVVCRHARRLRKKLAAKAARGEGG